MSSALTSAHPPSALQQIEPLSDEDVVARVIAGDGVVFELLMRRHNQRLYRVARSVVRNEHEAEDIVQETFVRAFTNLARFEGRSSVATWLTRIAFHEALRRRRRRRREPGVRRSEIRLEERVGEPIGNGLGLDAHSPADRPLENEDPLVREETRRLLTRALDSLPDGLRTVVMLRLVEGLSTRETAEGLRLSEANVKVTLHRARRMLTDAMQPQDLPRMREQLAEQQAAMQPQDLPRMREQFVFGAERCDRVVAEVFRRLGVRA